MVMKGVIKIITQNRKIIQYNHWNSCPSKLGINLLLELYQLFTNSTPTNIAYKFDQIILVNNKIKPTDEEIKKFKKIDTDVPVNKSHNDWYCLLKECQGSLLKILDSGYLLNETEHYEAFNYTIDFTSNQFICEKIGFKSKPHFKIPFSSIMDESYDENLFN